MLRRATTFLSSLSASISSIENMSVGVTAPVSSSTTKRSLGSKNLKISFFNGNRKCVRPRLPVKNLLRCKSYETSTILSSKKSSIVTNGYVVPKKPGSWRVDNVDGNDESMSYEAHFSPFQYIAPSIPCLLKTRGVLTSKGSPFTISVAYRLHVAIISY